jgi:signal peptidase I
MVLAGRFSAGIAALALSAFIPLAVVSSVGFLGLHPLKAILVLAVAWLALGIVLALEPIDSTSGNLAVRRLPGAIGLHLALLAAGFLLGIAPHFTLVRVEGLGFFPGLVPGELLLVRREDPSNRLPEPGELWIAGTLEGHRLGRVVGVPGDGVQITGPSLEINGKPVESEDIGEVLMKTPETLYPDEARSLRVNLETLGTHRYATFYRKGIELAPFAVEVPQDHFFLLCDNRSTDRPGDSRDLGTFPLEDLVGRPVRVIWSSPGGLWPRIERIGALWL